MNDTIKFVILGDNVRKLPQHDFPNCKFNMISVTTDVLVVDDDQLALTSNISMRKFCAFI